MKPNFRDMARKNLARATKLLRSSSDASIAYAALELREAMEAIVYDLAQGYEKELSPETYAKWQPRQLLGTLLEIDPYCDHDASLAVGLEDTPGQPAANMQYLGVERKLSLKTIKDHYDALGGYLHTPTLRQLANGQGHDIKKLRTRCEQIRVSVANVIESPISNVNSGNFTCLKCAECNSTITKRVTYLTSGEKLDAKCLSCGFPYKIAREEDGSFLWHSHTQEIKCIYGDCGQVANIRTDKLALGTVYRCPTCNRRMRFALGIVKLED